MSTCRPTWLSVLCCSCSAASPQHVGPSGHALNNSALSLNRREITKHSLSEHHIEPLGDTAGRLWYSVYVQPGSVSESLNCSTRGLGGWDVSEVYIASTCIAAEPAAVKGEPCLICWLSVAHVLRALCSRQLHADRNDTVCLQHLPVLAWHPIISCTIQQLLTSAGQSRTLVAERHAYGCMWAQLYITDIMTSASESVRAVDAVEAATKLVADLRFREVRTKGSRI